MVKPEGSKATFGVTNYRERILGRQHEEQLKFIICLAVGTEVNWALRDFEIGEDEPYSWSSSSCMIKVLAASST